MKKHIKLLVFALTLSILAIPVLAQKKPATGKLLKRTKYQTETFEIGAGGGFAIIGAPQGSIEIEGWQKNEIEITSEIQVQAYSEKDLDLIAGVTGFVVDEGLTRLSVRSLGTHDKKYIKKNFKKFPKKLRKANLPFHINYKIKVPHFTDLAVNGGKGDFRLSLVEGMMRINFLESNAKMKLVGGAIQTTIGKGDVDVTIATRSWRGQFAEVQVANGDLNVWLPKNLNANLKAKIIRTGGIENKYRKLKPMRFSKTTDKGMYVKVGNGGAELSFSVGDGNLKIDDFEKIAKK